LKAILLSTKITMLAITSVMREGGLSKALWGKARPDNKERMKRDNGYYYGQELEELLIVAYCQTLK
jgi:hypothetical protein